ncbi:aquaporin, partial [Streptomyces sp. NPDC005534]|uniref:aquaporin n=1 Tax=Streptomyces sp. NPDC005534 TaxID=3155714 RepID=UPI00345531D4
CSWRAPSAKERPGWTPRGPAARYEETGGPGANLGPFITGLLVVGIGMAWGTLAGYAINPARDFGPRLASFITGYGGAWRDQYGNIYFWVPIIGPLIGGLVGAGMYKLFIGRFLPTAEPEPAGRIPVSEQPKP